MKKIFLLIFAILIFAGTVASHFYVGDREAPTIKIKETPKLTCECQLKDLINYAKADDENLKSFFVESNGVEDVIDSKYITFVAIDEANNVTKLKSNVLIDEEYMVYHIETINELKIQKGTQFNVNDYFEVQNDCGTKVYDRLKVSDVNTKNVGTVDVQVTSSIKDAEPLEVSIEVIDEFAPKISLSKSEINYYTNTHWRDSDFINIIDILEDDEDSRQYLLDNMDINWRSVMHASEDGLVINPGNYVVTYTVYDSDGNVTKINVDVNLVNQPVVEVLGDNLGG